MRMPKKLCSSCGYVLDAVLNAVSDPRAKRSRRPTAGSISICLRCGHLMAFNHDLSLRELTSEEMYQVAGDKNILEIQAARAHVLLKKRTS